MKLYSNHKNTAKEKKSSPPLAAKIIKSFCGGRSKNEGWKGRKVEGEKTRRLKRRLKASKPCLSANPHELHNNRHFEVFTADTIQSKKPSVGPKGLIGPPCHGAPLADGGKHE